MKLNRLFAAAGTLPPRYPPVRARPGRQNRLRPQSGFSQYHTFSIHKIQTSDPLFEGRIRDEVTRDLTAHGLQMVPEGGDLSLTAIGDTRSQQEYETFYNGLGGGGFAGMGRGWGNSTTTVQQIPAGTLVVDLYAMDSHQLVWRGTASSQLSNKPDKNTQKVDKAIDKMFAKFPPKCAQ